MEIISITILHSHGTDQLMMEINKPNGCWPYNGQAYVKMEVAANSGEKYCENNFPNIPTKVINV